MVYFPEMDRGRPKTIGFIQLAQGCEKIPQKVEMRRRPNSETNRARTNTFDATSAMAIPLLFPGNEDRNLGRLVMLMVGVLKLMIGILLTKLHRNSSLSFALQSSNFLRCLSGGSFEIY